MSRRRRVLSALFSFSCCSLVLLHSSVVIPILSFTFSLILLIFFSMDSLLLTLFSYFSALEFEGDLISIARNPYSHVHV